MKPLIAALNFREKLIRDVAANALVRIRSPAVEPLMDRLKHEPSYLWGTGDLLAQIGSPAVEPLIAALEHPSFDVFVKVIKTLAALYKLGTLSDKQEQIILQQGKASRRLSLAGNHRDHGRGCGHHDSGRRHSDKHGDFSALL